MLISLDELTATRDKFEKINARAIKRGFTGRLELQAEEKTVVYENIVGFPITEIKYEVHVIGDPPAYGGWQLLAVLDWLSEDDVIVNTAPGVESVDRSKLRFGWCDHCQTSRRRVKSYLVGDGDRTMQVGSTCLKDFLGWDGQVVFLASESVENELDDFSGMSGHASPSYAPTTVLAAAWAAIKLHGFVRSSDHWAFPTVERVKEILNPPRKEAAKIRDTYGPLIDESQGRAAEVLAFLLSDDFSGDSEYVRNLKVLAEQSAVGLRHFGLLVSAPQAHAKWQEKTLVRQKERDARVNEYVGDKGDKIVIEARVKSVHWSEGQYGVTTIYELITKDGHVFKWFASREALGDEPTEDYLTIKGTVKGHDEYHDLKSTVLTRCKVIE